MNFNPKQTIPQSYSRDVLEGNWYEDRCVSDYDIQKGKLYKLKSPNDWQYERTYDELGKGYTNNETLKDKFSQSSDDYINFQPKNNNHYVTTYR